MNETAKVSIIVPIYNLEKYIDQCICSLIEQTFRDIEIILVDDGSTDSCPAICDDYARKDNRVTVLHQKNMGLSGARNSGIQMCHAKWLMIIDGDDWLEPDAVEFLYSNAEKYDSDLFIASYYSNSESEQIKDSFFSVDEFHFTTKEDMLNLQVNCVIKNSLAKMKSGSNMGATWARLYKKQIIINNNLAFILGLNRTQDAIFNLYALEHFKRVDFVDYPVQHYRVWRGSASRKVSKNFHLTAEKIANYIKEFMIVTNKEKVFAEAYYSKVTKLLFEIVKLELAPKANTDSFATKKKFLKQLASSDLYKTALLNVNVNTLTMGQKTGYYLLKYHCYGILLRIYSFKENRGC